MLLAQLCVVFAGLFEPLNAILGALYKVLLVDYCLKPFERVVRRKTNLLGSSV